MKKARHGDAETRSRPATAVTSGRASTVSPRLSVSASPIPSFRPSKRFGQNFLIDNRIVDRIVSALGPRADETIIEMGPGKGALPTRLIDSASRVIAIEFDRKLAPFLTDKFGARDNFKLVEADALTTDFCSEIAPAIQARVVANLPYNISTAL